MDFVHLCWRTLFRDRVGCELLKLDFWKTMNGVYGMTTGQRTATSGTSISCCSNTVEIEMQRRRVQLGGSYKRWLVQVRWSISLECELQTKILTNLMPKSIAHTKVGRRPSAQSPMPSSDVYVCACIKSMAPRLRHRSPRNFLKFSADLSSNSPIRKLNVRYTSTATDSAESTEKAFDPAFSLTTDRKPRAKKDAKFRTLAGVVLCRSPVITRELSEFETAFYAYQRHLKSRLSSPFPTDFYFQKGSLASKRWLAGEDERRQSNQLVPNVVKHSEEGELTGKEREMQDEDDVASSVSMSRVTEADRKNDTKSLDRRLDRTLYLLLKKSRSEHAWQFPQGPIGVGEFLHESTTRVLSSLAGADMNTWTVGRVPIGHLSYQFKQPDMGFEGNKVYFLKSRIFAGQCKLQESAGLEDFGWFTRDEVEERVSPVFWKLISSMLASQ